MVQIIIPAFIGVLFAAFQFWLVTKVELRGQHGAESANNPLMACDESEGNKEEKKFLDLNRLNKTVSDIFCNARFTSRYSRWAPTSGSAICSSTGWDMNQADHARKAAAWREQKQQKFVFGTSKSTAFSMLMKLGYDKKEGYKVLLEDGAQTFEPCDQDV